MRVDAEPKDMFARGGTRCSCDNRDLFVDGFCGSWKVDGGLSASSDSGDDSFGALSGLADDMPGSSVSDSDNDSFRFAFRWAMPQAVAALGRSRSVFEALPGVARFVASCVSC